MNLIFDSSALIAYLHNEDGVDIAEYLLLDQNNKCFVHAVNLCEVYYEVLRLGGEETAQATLAALRRTCLVARDDMDDEFWQNAGQIKADYSRISLVDCFCISLANRLSAEIVTCDRHELEPIAKAGICKTKYVR